MRIIELLRNRLISRAVIISLLLEENMTWLLLDLDGVFVSDYKPEWKTVTLPTSRKIIIHPDTYAMIKRLQNCGNIYWQTLWGKSANKNFSPALGLPEFPLVPWEPYSHFGASGPQAKLHGLQDLVARHNYNGPIVWIEDGFSKDTQDWAVHRGGVFLVDTTENYITWKDIQDIEYWHKKNTYTSPDKIWSPCMAASPIIQVVDVSPNMVILSCGHTIARRTGDNYEKGQNRRCSLCSLQKSSGTTKSLQYSTVR